MISLNCTNSPSFVSNCKVNKADKNSSDSKISKKAKAAIVLGCVGAALAITYFVTRRRVPTDSVHEVINKNIDSSVSFVQDTLGYKIQPPTYDPNIVISKGESGYTIYQDVLSNIHKDASTAQRLSEASLTMTEDMNKIINKMADSGACERTTIPQGAGIFDLDIAKKRFFSIPANRQKGYSGLDPLLYQKSREEIIDLHIGYGLLEALNENSESRYLNNMINAYRDKLSDADSKYIQQCVSKLIPPEAKCYGGQSVLHSSDLSRIGQIFREAMKLKVR